MVHLPKKRCLAPVRFWTRRCRNPAGRFGFCETHRLFPAFFLIGTLGFFGSLASIYSVIRLPSSSISDKNVRVRYHRFSNSCYILDFLANTGVFADQFGDSYRVRTPVTEFLEDISTTFPHKPHEGEPACVGWTNPRNLVQLLPGIGHDDLLNSLLQNDAVSLLDFHIKRQPDDYEYKAAIIGFPNFLELQELLERNRKQMDTKKIGDIWVFAENTDPIGLILARENPETRGAFLIYSELRNREICDYEESFQGAQAIKDLYYARALTTGSETTGTFILSRYLEFAVAEIENVGNQPLNGMSIRCGLSPGDTENKLRFWDSSIERDQTLKSPVTYDVPFSLQPGERILLPIEVSLGPEFGAQELLFDIESMAKTQETTLSHLPDPVTLHFIWPIYRSDVGEEHPWVKDPLTTMEPILVAEDGTRIFLVSKQVPREVFLHKTPVDEISPIRRHFGPAMNIESIVAKNGWRKSTIKVRAPDWDQHLETVSAEIGSCPRVLTHSSSENRWLQDTKILVNNESPLKKGQEITRLTRFDGKLLVREDEEETSYIDQLLIVVVREGGGIDHLRPDNQAVALVDDDVLVLQQGEEALISYPGFNTGETAKGVFLVATGYFDLFRR